MYVYFFNVKLVVNVRKKIKINTDDIRLDRGYDEFIFNCRTRNLRTATIRFHDNSIRTITCLFRKN